MFERLGEPQDETALPSVQFASITLDFDTDEDTARETLPAHTGAAWTRFWREWAPDARVARSSLQRITVQASPIAAESQQTPLLSGVQGRTGGFAASLYSSVLSIEEFSYTDWDAFFEKATVTLEALTQIMDPKLLTRLAVRFSAVMRDPTADTPALWLAKIPTAFGSALRDGDLADGYLAGIFSQYGLRDGDIVAQVRCAIQKDANTAGTYAFISDVELTDDTLHPFALPDVVNILGEMQRGALRIESKIAGQ